MQQAQPVPGVSSVAVQSVSTGASEAEKVAKKAIRAMRSNMKIPHGDRPSSPLGPDG
ncbi:MAG: hypothetical protein AAF937_04625 [Planctomycetota bacterium]